MSDFLKNLKDSLDNKEFNSESVNKINEIYEKSLKVNVDENSVVDKNNVPEAELTNEYQEKMNYFIMEDKLNLFLANVDNLENDIKKVIDDLFLYIEHIEENIPSFENEVRFKDNLDMLKEKITIFKEKYVNFLNK
jgi:hypothetical protein